MGAFLPVKTVSAPVNRWYGTVSILHASQQKASVLVRPPTFSPVSFMKPSALLAFFRAPGTSFAKLKAPSLLLNK